MHIFDFRAHGLNTTHIPIFMHLGCFEVWAEDVDQETFEGQRTGTYTQEESNPPPPSTLTRRQLT